MKKILSYVLAASALSISVASAGDFVCFNSVRILQEAKENQKISGELNGKIEELQLFVKDSQQKLIDMEAELNKKATVLSKEAAQEKTEEIVQKKKDFERIIADKKDKLEKDIQRRQAVLRTKQIEIINRVCKRENWSILVDVNAPGVVYASDAIDRTDTLIKEIDQAYDAESTKKASEKSSPKTSTKTKTA